MVVKSDGSIYFTDPGGPSPETELDFSGVYRVSADLGAINLLVRDYVLPNGLCFSPDESILYINDSQGLNVDPSIYSAASGTLTLSTCGPTECWPTGGSSAS